MEVEKYISYQIEKQFPSIYLEEGKELVELVKNYYEFLETNDKQSVYRSRRMFEYRDIDRTLNEMLIFFRNKYMKDLPYTGENTRFVVKNILDLYRAKGSETGIKLFFRMFYNSNVKVYYPSYEMIKPSSSKWKQDKYLELFPGDPTKLNNIVGGIIKGSITHSTAVVERIRFIIENNIFIPILFLSEIKGEFIGLEDIYFGDIKYGKISGSLGDITNLNIGLGDSNNKIGDEVKIISETGKGASGRVREVTKDSRGAVTYTLEDGGFGYTLSDSEIIVSNQIIFCDNSNTQFNIMERITQGDAEGFVIGQNEYSIGVSYIPSSNTSFFSSGIFSTLDRDINLNVLARDVSPYNNTTSLSPGSLENILEIDLITDIIGDYFTVAFDDPDYGMSGGAGINFTSTFEEAFSTSSVTLGSISSLTNINPGIGYVSGVFVLALDNFSNNYGFPVYNVELSIDDYIKTKRYDIISQTNGSFGIITKKTNGILNITQTSFVQFDNSLSFFLNNSLISFNATNLNKIIFNNISSLGSDAIIVGESGFIGGKISAIDIIDSGLSYQNGQRVDVFNTSKLDRYKTEILKYSFGSNEYEDLYELIEKTTNEPSIIGIASVRSQGKSRGYWETQDSQLNQKIIQDSDYYQDYSYEIVSNILEKNFIKEFKNVMHLSGTKMFTKFDTTEEINSKIEIEMHYSVDEE